MPPPRRLGEFKLTSLLLLSWLFVTLKAWLPQRFCSFFVILLGLVAFLFFLLGGWAPLAALSSSPWPMWPFFLLGGWVPLAVFSRCFPHGSREVGGRVLCFCFSCYLLLLASFLSLLQLGQYGLPTRKPPGPPRPFPWCVGPDPSPAGSRRSDAPRLRAGG